MYRYKSNKKITSLPTEVYVFDPLNPFIDGPVLLL